MSNAAQVDDAFRRVDQFLAVAGEVAPSVELLLSRAKQNGVTEHQLAANLRATTPVLRWLLKLSPDATANRIDLEGDDADLADLVLRWARS
jgi:hypothetical protein